MSVAGPDVLVLEPTGRRLGDVLWLHGFGLCGPFYEGAGRELAARGWRVTLPTLPGFDGRPPADTPGWAALVDHVERWVEAHLASGGLLVGHSMGGMLAFLAAARGAPVDGLVLVEPAIVPWPLLSRVAAGWYGRRADAAAGTFRNRGPGYTRVHDPACFPEAAMRVALRAGAGVDAATQRALVTGYPDLHPLPWAKITRPVCTVRGGSSGLSQWLGQRALRRLPVTREVVIPGAGHWVANEQDASLAAAVAEFGATVAPVVSARGRR